MTALREEAGWISARGLTRRFGARTALAPLDLDVAPGTVTGLLGPNGSGKSTLLRMLLGITPPSGGAACVDGVALRGDGTAVRHRVAYMPGEIGVYGEMSGREHLRWLLRGRGREALARAREVAEELGLDLRRRVRTFSQGMKRQLFFAAALGPRVRVRILDEPTDGLDPSTRRRVLERIRSDVRRGVTVFLSSHHLAEVEDVCERLVFLSEGRLLSDESSRELRERARSIVHLAWRTAPEPDALRRALEGLGPARITVAGRRATARLEDGDPLAWVAGLRGLAGAPAPDAVEFGTPSLGDLYRDLYGVEGL